MNATLPILERHFMREQLAQSNPRLVVGAHVIDVGALRIVTRPDHPRLTGKAIGVLLELVRHAGDTVTRDHLLEHVWRDRVTTPDVVTQAIKELRHAFADDGRAPKYIETIPRVGYRLIAAVGVPSADALLAAVPSGEAANMPRTHADNLAEPILRVSPRSWHWRRVAWIALVLSASVALAVGLRTIDAPRPAPAIWRASEVRAITSDPGAEQRPHLSPDGTRLAYVKVAPGDAVSRIYLRALEPSRVNLLTSSVDGFEAAPAWSPDGSQIAFERLGSHSCRFFVASSGGGGEREISTCEDYATNYFDWAPDGKSLIAAERSAGAGDLMLERLDLATGSKQPISYAHARNDQDLEPHYSPDGRWIAFRRGIAPYSDLCVMPSGGGAVRQLTHLAARIRGYTWTPDSSALLFASNMNGEFALYTIAIAESRVAPLDVAPAMYPAIAHNGATVVYEIPRSSSALMELPVHAGAQPKLLAPSTGSDNSPVLAPDGERVAFISNRSGSPQLWLYDPATDSASPLTELRGSVLLNPNWSADGKRLLVTVKRAEEANLIEIDLASRRQHTINKPDERVLSGSYGPEAASFLITIGVSSPEDALVYVRDAGTPRESRTTLATSVAHAELDAPARRVYYTKTAERGLFRRDLGGGDEQFVTALVTSILIDGWRVVQGKIWHVRDIEFNPTEIREFDPQSGQDLAVGVFPVELDDINFSVSAAADRIIMAPVATQDTDIGAFQLTPVR